MIVTVDARALGQQRTGDETYTRELLYNLSNIQGIELHALFLSRPQKEVEQSLKERNITIQIIPSPHRALWTFWSMPKALKKIQPDILHTQYTTPQWWSPMPKKTRIITTIHDLGYKHYPKWITLRDRILWNIFLKPSTKKASRIIAVSKNTKQDILKFLTQTTPIDTIHNGIEEVYKEKHLTDNIQEKYKLKKPYALYLGTLQERKNIPFLLRAWDSAKEKLPQQTELVIAGNRHGHNSDKRIETTYQELKHKDSIKFIGYVNEEEKPSLFQKAKLFCWPSLYEGFGHPPLEALATGTPVVALRTSCNSEILKDWVIYADQTEHDMAEKIVQTFGKKQKKIFTYSWSNTAKQTYKTYKKALEKDKNE